MVIQTYVIVFYSSSSKNHIIYFWPKIFENIWIFEGFSHFNEHRFRYNFQYCLNPLCFCSLEIEDTLYFLLPHHRFSHHSVVFINSVKFVYNNFESMPDNAKKDLLLFRDSWFNENKNKVILEATISYIKILKILWFSFWMFCDWMISTFKFIRTLSSIRIFVALFRVC